MQTNLTTSNKPKIKIITEYKPEYCDLYIEYANHYINPNGFWGEYNIDESVKETWISTYPEFAQVINLIPNITTNIINKNLETLLTRAVQVNDTRLVAQILLKVLDFQFRNDKESGEIREKAKVNKSARDKGDLTINVEDEQMVKDFLAKRAIGE